MEFFTNSHCADGFWHGAGPLITPSEMGILGLTAIFFAVAGCLAEAGFGAALIRKSDMTDEDVDTMFWFNLLMSFVLSLTLFLLAPWFASFYQQPELLWLTRVSAVMMLMMSTTNVHKTLFQRRRDFKTLAKIGMLSAFSGMPILSVAGMAGLGRMGPDGAECCGVIRLIITVMDSLPLETSICFFLASFP